MDNQSNEPEATPRRLVSTDQRATIYGLHRLHPEDPRPVQISLNKCANDWSNSRSAARREDDEIQRILVILDVIHIRDHAYASMI